MKRAGSRKAARLKPRLLLVDPHRLFRTGLRRLFIDAGDFGRVGTVGSIDQALAMLSGWTADVAILSTAFLCANPFEPIRRLRESATPLRIVLMDDAFRPLYLRVALQASTHGYWTKHDSFAGLRSAMRQVAGGEPAFCRAALDCLTLEADGYRFRPRAQTSRFAKLTPRELEVVLHLAEGYSVRETAEMLNLARSTADNHKSRAMRKLGVHKAVDLALLAIREGLVR